MLDNKLEWLSNSYLPDGTIWMSLARVDHCYLFRFTGMAEFTFDPLKQVVSYVRLADIPQETLDHLYYNQVTPLIKVYNGETVLHGSAVVFQIKNSGTQAAVAFLGESGQGKSTLAAAFCQIGFSMLTDDCLTIEEQNGQVIGRPGFPGIRLWPDTVEHFYAEEGKWFAPVAHYTEKQHVSAQKGRLELCSRPVAIRRIYLLDNNPEHDADGNISITPVTPREAFIGLLENTFRLDNQGERITREFSFFSELAEHQIFFRLSFSRFFNLLPKVCQTIQTHMNMI